MGSVIGLHLSIRVPGEVSRYLSGSNGFDPLWVLTEVGDQYLVFESPIFFNCGESLFNGSVLRVWGCG